jgi:hypothetical protein
MVRVRDLQSDLINTVNPSSVRKGRYEGGQSNTEKEALKKVGKEVEKEFEIVVWLTALREIKAGEALTVSYLSQLCTPCSTRRDMLQQSFFFHCLCQKCVREGIEGPGSHLRSLQSCRKDLSPATPSSTSTVPLSPSYRTVYTTDLDSESFTKTALRSELNKAMRRIQDPGSTSPLDTSSSDNDNKGLRGSQSDAVKGTLTTAEMIDLMELVEHAYSSLPKSRKSVRTTLRTTVRTTVSTNAEGVEKDDIYTIHDAGMLVLGAAMKSRNLGPRSPKVGDLGSDSMADELIVRASKVVSDCWMLVECEVSGDIRIRIEGEMRKREFTNQFYAFHHLRLQHSSF